MRCRVATVLALILHCCASVASAQRTDSESLEFFESKIRPLLTERCQQCHGQQKQWAGLRLDSSDALSKGGESGPVVVPGKPDASELIVRLTADAESRMPPADAGPALSAEQISNLRRWIAHGAVWPATDSVVADSGSRTWQEHWAFQAVKRTSPPTVRDSAWMRNPIDQFVAHKIEIAGLQPSAEADRRTLIRRATYDLTGLPPSQEEVADFLSDAAPDAYERRIDRLLASPRYGEHWGRHWLDVARYSDTKGYVYGREERFFVNSSLYRDWVIGALNDDLPFDRFVLLQLAADQVAMDDPKQLAAMGFLTLGRRFLGVPSDIIDDRIDVVGRGLLGLTVGCARCHDHKYDPIPTADYYSLYGVFQNCFEDRIAIPRQPGVPEPTPEFEQGLRERIRKLEEATTKSRAELEDHIRTHLPQYLLAQRELEKYPEVAFSVLTNKGDILPGIVRQWETYLATVSQDDPVFSAWNAFAQLKDDEFAAAVEVTRQLQSDVSRLNPRVAEAFSQPPASILEVAERYGRIFADVDAAWLRRCNEAKVGNSAPPTALPDAASEELRQVLYGAQSPCVIPDEPLVSTEFLWDTATVVELWALQAEVDRWLLRAPATIPHAVVLTDRKQLVEPRIFRRGDPANKGDEVPRQFLQVIAGSTRKPFQHGSGRFELAQAIVDPANPLTARVWVNRVWSHHFGAGLVETPSDFGRRSSAPSHPELLDWLSSEFIEGGWTNKSLHKQMMLSATYRQDSRGAAELVARANALDPENRLLWRMNPRRLSFEQYRDSLLAFSGELDLTMGGKGSDLFGLRRSAYTQVDRQFLPSVMSMFDFANPDLHAPQRSESTIPQQALFGWNHPFVASRARGAAARAKDTTDTEQIRQLYQQMFQREPSPVELHSAQEFLSSADQPTSIDKDSPSSTWSYGYGWLDENSGRVVSFTALPYFTGSAWQGGPEWPDATLGWVQLTAQGGHPGNDKQHAAVRRWTAPFACRIAIDSEVAHASPAGDGIQCWIVSSRHGLLKSCSVHNRRERIDLESITVEPGDKIDFVVDVAGVLNNDQYLWPTLITKMNEATAAADAAVAPVITEWHAERDFGGPAIMPLSPLEQLTQLLLISNEAMFID